MKHYEDKMAMLASASNWQLRHELVTTLPTVGSVWHWEPLAPHASVEVMVTDVRWNGDEVQVQSRPTAGGEPYWNDLSRWVEAAVLVRPAPGDE